MGGNACDKSQYLPIQAVEVKGKFGWVLDDLLEKYYAKHQTGKKTLGAVKKEFKNDLATVYGISLDTFNAIHRDKYQSISKKILFKLCFALELEYEEAKMLLESAGLDFKRSNKFELVIEAILKCDSHRRFIICEIDETLERNGCEPLFY